MEKQHQPTLADAACELRTKKIKNNFLSEVNALIDWQPIKEIIDKDYKKGKSAVGKPSYSGLLLFKILLLEYWYGLSDYEVEERINDSISFSYFCGISIDEVSPDHSTISRFRTALTQKGTFEKLFAEINRQLEALNIIVKKGVIVDASIVDTPLKPKGKTTYKVVEDELSEVHLEKDYPPSVDREAAWVVKGGEIRYGYKRVYLGEDTHGLVLSVYTTSANVNDTNLLEPVLKKVTIKLPKHIPLKGDKGFQSKKNAEILKDWDLKNHIQKKATRNHKLTYWEKEFNKLIGKTRYKIERVFGSIKRWFNGGIARYRGLAKMHTQNLMEAMCYNLYRSPGIMKNLYKT